MLWIFDQKYCDQKNGARELWLDLGLSLLRQSMLRSPLWIVAPAVAGSFVAMFLTSLTCGVTRRVLKHATASPDAFIVLATAGSL